MNTFHNNPHKSTLIYEFTHYFSNLNSIGLATLLKDDVLYDELPKDDWIALFEKQFESFKQEKISFLKPIPGSCLGCKKGCSGFTFLDEDSGFYVDLVIESNAAEITDFTECVNLKNEMKVAGKKEQIFINELGEINDIYQCPF
jgi:hypothetical protein